MTSDQPWKNESLLREMYCEKEMTQYEISEEFGCSQSVISTWLDKHHIDARDTGPRNKSAKSWQDCGILSQLYLDEKKSIAEVADYLDCSSSAVRRGLRKCGIECRKANHEKPALFETSVNGYERWRTHVGDKRECVRVHRLLAVAEYGFDSVVGMDVHHENHIPWDNRTQNIELLSHGDHMALHRIREGSGGQA